jgi:2-polyprenyl-6-hydroxyphenyl methylase/3-demethylubiquinone-9 3-methyltransferase
MALSSMRPAFGTANTRISRFVSDARSFETCKCCHASAPFLGMVDFNKTCMDVRGPRPFPPTGEVVPYYRCPNCGFIFTTYCDRWTQEEFRRRIYNDEYEKADYDPAIVDGLRATVSYQKGKNLAALLTGSKDRIRLLDFGASGNPGRTGQALIDSGFNVTSYEPYFGDSSTRVEGTFDVIYALEVFEHCNDLAGVADFIAEHLAENGLLYFSTLLHPYPSNDSVLDSWYIAPRNGHISIFTFQAIAVLFRRVEINVVQSLYSLVGLRNPTKFPNLLFV